MKSSGKGPFLSMSLVASLALVAFSLAAVHSQTLGSFNPSPDNDVYALAVQSDGKILVGGAFSTLGGEPHKSIGRLNCDGSVDTDFHPTVSHGVGTNSVVYSLARQEDGQILVGGAFVLLGGQERQNIGRLHDDGTPDMSFNPGASREVYCLALQADGKILVGGTFTNLGGESCNYCGRLNPSGTLDSGFIPAPDGSVYSLAVQADGKILIGGSFSTLAGQPCTNIGRFNADGTLDTAFVGVTDGTVICLAVQADGKILAGGLFTTVNGEMRNAIVRLNSNGTLDSGFDPNASGGSYPFVYSIAEQANGKVLVGGGFDSLAGHACQGIGRLNTTGELDPTFNPGADGSVFCIAIQPDGGILAGGNFSALDGVACESLGRLENNEPSIQTLTFDGSKASWGRSGSSPEVWRASFASSTNGIDWVNLGTGTRFPGGWELAGITLRADAALRARGFTTGGYQCGSSWFVESTQPTLRLGGFEPNGFGFNIISSPGQVVIVEGSTDQVNWIALATNTISVGPLPFNDSASSNFTKRFYRVKGL